MIKPNLESNLAPIDKRGNQQTTAKRKKMAFLSQLSSKFQEIKNTQLPQVLEQANKARQNLMPVINKCTQQLTTVGHQIDALGKILQVKIHTAIRAAKHSNCN